MCYKCARVKDLTAYSIGKHILQMALPIAAEMLFQTLYFAFATAVPEAA